MQGTLGRIDCDPIEPFSIRAILPGTVETIEAPGVCGDADGSGSLDISDAVRLLGFLFLGDARAPCGPADVNGDGELDIADPIFLFRFLFLGGPAPACP